MFKIGDVVELVVDHPEGKRSLLRGHKGRVKCAYIKDWVGISFEGWQDGHSLRGSVGDRSGWNVHISCVKLCNDNRVKTLPFELGLV